MLSSHFSLGREPQVGHQTACICLRVGPLAFMLLRIRQYEKETCSSLHSEIRIALEKSPFHPLISRAGVIQSSNWPHARAIWACRAAFLGRRILLLVDLRSGLGDAAFYEISLNLELLLWAQVHHGVEGQVAG